MKVLLNAVSIKEGGATVVLLKRLASLRQMRPDIEWIIAANSNARFAATPDPMVTWVMTSWIDKSPLHAFIWYEFVLPAMIRKHQPDLVFSQTNFLPLHKLTCPTLLLVQHAGYFSAEFARLMREWKPSWLTAVIWRLRTLWVRHSVRTATCVTVQTHALAKAIEACVKRSAKDILVIPEGPGLARQLGAPRSTRRPDIFRIGYVTNWGVQKNFETLFRAAHILRAAGYRFKIVLTLCEKDPRCQPIFAAAEEIGVADLIENHGLVGQDAVYCVYDSLDIFAFPSLCESFGLPMIEAMARGLPIVVAATPENIEMTQGAGMSFSPKDANALSAHLAKLIDDDEERTRRGRVSLARSHDFAWERTASQTIRAFERAIGELAKDGSSVSRQPPKSANFQPKDFTPKDLMAIDAASGKLSGDISRLSLHSAMSSNFQIKDFTAGSKN